MRQHQRQKQEYDPCTIAKNLRALMQSQQLSIHETMAAISENGKCEPKEYRWLKRVAAKGIIQTDKRSMARLEKLAEFFGVTVEQMRTDDLDRMLVYQEFNQPDSPGFRRYASMLEELLSDEFYGNTAEVVLLTLHLCAASPQARMSELHAAVTDYAGEVRNAECHISRFGTSSNGWSGGSLTGTTVGRRSRWKGPRASSASSSLTSTTR